MRLNARRIRFLLLVILFITFAIVYLVTAKRITRSSPFYAKTQALLAKAHYDNDVANAMANAGDSEAAKKVKNRSPTGEDRINDAKAQQDAGLGRLEDTSKERLRLAEIAAKKSADKKWKGVREAAGKAIDDHSKDRPEGAEAAVKENESKREGADGKENQAEISSKDETGRHAANAADAVVKIMQEVKRSVTEEVNHEKAGEAPVAAKVVEKSLEKVEALISEVSSDQDTAAELRRKILEAREREKEDLKAEMRQQLRKREMERQRAAGKKLKAVDPAFQERLRLHKLGPKVVKPLQKPSATSKPPPVPTTPAEVEFHKLLALSPVTIFSKSYCPYSKKAKRILTQAFDITPSPYVVELDKHDMGAELQAILLEKTRRRTVPNVIIAGKSIGGGDEVEQLWESGKLRQTIKQLAGRRIAGVVENEDIMKKGWRN